MRLRFRAVGWLMTSVLVVLALVACTPTATPSSSKAAGASAPPSAAGTPAASTAPVAPTEHLRVAWTAPAAGYLSLHSAMEQGMFEKRGLAVDLTLTSAAQAVSALLAREIDVAQTDGASLVRAGLAGGETVIIGVTTPSFTQKLIAHPSITRPEGLRGKRLGITRAGSVSDFAARYMLGGYGLQGDTDVALIQLGAYPEMVGAMMAGAVDAALLIEPVAAEARQQGFVLVLDLATLGVEYPSTGLGTLRSIVSERPGALRAFVGGMVEATAWMKAHRAEALEILARYTQMEAPSALAAAYEENVPRAPQAPYPTEASVATILEWIRETDPRAANARPADFIDDRFVRELDDSGYIRQLYQ
jgi:ABC-type nitrate/sulfonate/bicarbonate transport system substrate-binding protein